MPPRQKAAPAARRRSRVRPRQHRVALYTAVEVAKDLQQAIRIGVWSLARRRDGPAFETPPAGAARESGRARRRCCCAGSSGPIKRCPVSAKSNVLAQAHAKRERIAVEVWQQRRERSPRGLGLDRRPLTRQAQPPPRQTRADVPDRRSDARRVARRRVDLEDVSAAG